MKLLNYTLLFLLFLIMIYSSRLRKLHSVFDIINDNSLLEQTKVFNHINKNFQSNSQR